MPRTNTNLSLVLKVRHIYKKKGWPLPEKYKRWPLPGRDLAGIDKMNDRFVCGEFDRFCSRLQRISDKERSFILELTEDFLRIDANSYPSHFFQSLKEYYDEGRSDERIIFLNVHEEWKADSAKSQDSVAYQTAVKAVEVDSSWGNDIPISAKLEFRKLRVKKINKKLCIDNLGFKIRTNCHYCIIDDYSGSGDTAETYLKLLYESIHEKNPNINKSSVGFLALAAQEEAKIRIREEGFSFWCGTVLKKGISDYRRKNGNTQTMENLEKKIGITGDDLLGYGSCEALIQLINTPNNTFPYYWKNGPKGGIKDAPFPRK